jgi:serine/threonine-protein kinase
MVINKIDGISFRLKKLRDFSWLNRYGTAFCVIDETGSGCLCIGMQKGNSKYFCKIAGADTIEAEMSPRESVEVLKNSVHLYKDIQHPNLIKIIEDYEYDELYIVVYEWAEGECLFDHWNFEKYRKNPSLKSPAERFEKLPIKAKLDSAEVLFSFLEAVSNAGYVAVDFYDGSIMYDFCTGVTTICDIDFFKKKPIVNDMGQDWWGTKRFKAPEEYILGAKIDEDTNVFTLGALIFDFFGEFTDEEYAKRYDENQFTPCSPDKWKLNSDTYSVALKATHLDREKRYQTISEFHSAWRAAWDKIFI